MPPANTPTPAEIATCRQFLSARLDALPNLTCIGALGRVAHDSSLAALSARKSAFPFKYEARHSVTYINGTTVVLFDSYHCSRYNTKTGVLTTTMFEAVFAAVRAHLN